MSKKHSWIIKKGKQICKNCGCYAVSNPIINGQPTGCKGKKKRQQK